MIKFFKKSNRVEERILFFDQQTGKIIDSEHLSIKCRGLSQVNSMVDTRKSSSTIEEIFTLDDFDDLGTGYQLVKEVYKYFKVDRQGVILGINKPLPQTPYQDPIYNLSNENINTDNINRLTFYNTFYNGLIGLSTIPSYLRPILFRLFMGVLVRLVSGLIFVLIYIIYIKFNSPILNEPIIDMSIIDYDSWINSFINPPSYNDSQSLYGILPSYKESQLLYKPLPAAPGSYKDLPVLNKDLPMLPINPSLILNKIYNAFSSWN